MPKCEKPPAVGPAREEAQASQRVVCAALIRDPRNADEAAGLLDASDFTDPLCQDVFESVLELVRSGRPVDVATVCAGVLARRPGCPGGPVAHQVLELAESWAGNWGHHAGRVRDASTVRRLREAGERIAALAASPSAPPAELVAEAARVLAEVEDRAAGRGPAALADAINEVFARIDARQAAGRPDGLSSGVGALDEITAGFRPGELIILAARPSVGKTSIGLAFARAAAEQGRPVLIASCEQGREELGERALAAEAEVDSLILRDHDVGEATMSLLIEARNRLAGLPVWIDDAPRQSAFHVAAAARRLKRRGGLGLVVVDYVGLMAVEERAGKKRHELVGEISRELKLAARELGVPLILLAQLNREVESRGANARPRLSDLRESGSLEQDADVVILMHRPQEPGAGPRPWQSLELIVAKNRNGPTGECLVRFVRRQMRFEEAAGDPFAGGAR